MIGNRYWSTGITVKATTDGAWGASVFYQDNGDARDASTQGTLHTRYHLRDTADRNALAYVIDLVKRDAERLGIEWRGVFGGMPRLFFQGDGEDPEWPPPEGWRELLTAQAERIGWQSYGTAARS